MAIQTIKFDPTQLDNPAVTTRAFNGGGAIQVVDLEYHPEVTQGPCITGHVFQQDASIRILGLWDKEGKSIANSAVPNLIQEAEVQTPDVRTAFVNVYRCTENEVGFSIGTKTCATFEDARARGQRNTRGNYVCTIPVIVDMNDATRGLVPPDVNNAAQE